MNSLSDPDHRVISDPRHIEIRYLFSDRFYGLSHVCVVCRGWQSNAQQTPEHDRPNVSTTERHEHKPRKT